MATETERKVLNMQIPAELHRRIRVLAAMEDKPMTQWVREALELVASRQEARNA